jgi:hypothetical protein
LLARNFWVRGFRVALEFTTAVAWAVTLICGAARLFSREKAQMTQKNVEGERDGECSKSGQGIEQDQILEEELRIAEAVPPIIFGRGGFLDYGQGRRSL